MPTMQDRLLTLLDRVHARLEEDVPFGERRPDDSDLFNEIGCLIAEAKGE